ncbi:MAG: hypothetical protein FJY07_07965 [Bacteroidetes bacterium]|nr:hypothetical protein [Bacteroidota bacterium]
MKKTQYNNQCLLVTAMLFTVVISNAQFYPTGGYQGGLYGKGGDQTFEFLNPPGNLRATGGDSEVLLSWDAPFPIGEVKYDDSSAEMWYWLNSPSSGNDCFYVKFTSPRDGFLTDIAVLNSASWSSQWQSILVCPDNGAGKPNMASPWNSFPLITVSSLPQAGGEWEVLSMPVPVAVSAGSVFYIVTRWKTGSTTGPFVGTDTGSNSGRSAWSVNGGTTWNLWTENFIMRAFITSEPVANINLLSPPKANAGSLPVKSLATGEVVLYKADKIAASLFIPSFTLQGKGIIGLVVYRIFRSETTSGPYEFLDSSSGTSYPDATAINDVEYFYVVTAQYEKGEAEYSNEASALPQAAAALSFQNNFDTNDGGFYPKGEWEWGAPAYAGGPPSAYSPPNLWGTNLDGNYGNFTNSWLIQPFDIHYSSTIKVSFRTWYMTQSNKDFCYFAIDHDYDNVYDILATYNGNSAGWKLKEIIVPDSLKSDYSRFAFILLSDHVTTYAGFYIDDLKAESIVEVNLKAYLEGPFTGLEMTTNLNSSGIIPLSQPFNSNPMAPWYYTGSESVGMIPGSNITDWILVELRQTPGSASEATSATMIARSAGFILKNGSIVSLDGASNLRIAAGIDQNLYVVLWHRNHLGIMSASGLLKTSGIYSWNFSAEAGKVFGGGDAHKELVPGIWGMISGDADGNELIEEPDKITIWEMQSGTSGYKSGDFNLDSEVNNPDKNGEWIPNLGKGSYVPD